MSTPRDHEKHLDAQGQDRSSDQRSAAATSGEGSAHTPGPWACSKHVLNAGRVVTREAHLLRPFGGSVDPERCRETYMQHIASVGQHPCHLTKGVAEADANAHLIAAAPDLYAACRALLAYHQWAISGEWRDEPVEPTTMAQAALAKAEGRR